MLRLFSSSGETGQASDAAVAALSEPGETSTDSSSGANEGPTVKQVVVGEAWVSVGLSHGTAEFAVQTIRTWRHEMGAPKYPDATSLLFTADGGGSNGYRLRLWKHELLQLVDDLGFPKPRALCEASRPQLIPHALSRPFERSRSYQRSGGSQPAR